MLIHCEELGHLGVFVLESQNNTLSNQFRQNGDGTKLSLQMDAVLVPAGMPNVPGMEDMMKTQMKSGLDTTMAATKKAIEG